MAQGIDTRTSLVAVIGGVPVLNEILSFREPKLEMAKETVTTGVVEREINLRLQKLDFEMKLAGDRNLLEPVLAGGLNDALNIIVTGSTISEHQVSSVIEHDMQAYISSIDAGEFKTGEKGEFTIRGSVIAYKKSINSVNICDVDVRTGKCDLGSSSLGLLASIAG